MEILFVRHATAEAAGRGGDAARKLTGKGVQEAKMLAGALKAMGVAPDKVLTSPLARAAQTAAILGERLGADVEESALLAPGGDRQELHESIRTHSMAAGRKVKEEGKDNDLLERIAENVVPPKKAVAPP